jgi:HlyD family secretion protein
MQILKWFLGAALTLAIIALGIGVFLGPQIRDLVNQDNAASGPEVRIEAAERGRIVRAVSAPGDIEPRSKVQISARTSAQIESLPFEEGDTVKAGDVVVRLDDRDLLASLDAARARLRGEEARLEGARAAYINANLEWERVSQLFDTADVPKSEVDQAEANLRSAESSLNAAKHAVAGAEAEVARTEQQLNYTTIRSPIDGRVTVLNAEVGEIVVTGTMNNAGTVIMEIADLSEMLVRAQVDEIDISRVEAGQPALVYVNAYPEEPFEGEVRRIALQSQRDTSGAKFYDTEVAVFMGERALYAGLSATVDIEVETAEGVILVPTQAVMDKRTEELPVEVRNSPLAQRDKTFTPVVYVFEDGKAMARPVEAGFSDLTQTSILAGLEPGEEVIVGPWSELQKLEHGKSVQREAAPGEDAEEAGATDEAAGEDESDAEGEPAESEAVTS